MRSRLALAGASARLRCDPESLDMVLSAMRPLVRAGLGGGGRGVLPLAYTGTVPLGQAADVHVHVRRVTHLRGDAILLHTSGFPPFGSAGPRPPELGSGAAGHRVTNL